MLSWVKQRFQDLFLWPYNLIRDLPRRLRRIVESALQLLQGLLFFLPELLDAIRFGETKLWLRFKIGRMFFWTHGLLAQLFDLVGGPEFAQLVLLRPWARATPLTADEIASMKEVLEPASIRYEEVRVLEGGLLNLVFRFNGNLAFAAWRSVCLPSDGRHTRANRPILVHELTHVYQYEQVGSRYLGEAIYMLIKTQRDCYNYGGQPGLVMAALCSTHYCDFNREQQAMITQDYYALLKAKADVSGYGPFLAELRSGKL